MNWLAHIFISENDIDYRLGNLLADTLKGRAWQGCSNKLLQGMQMHQAIDAFTDAHDCVRCSKARLGNSGYLRGVVIDIVYDHLLLKNWELYSRQSLQKFIQNFNHHAKVAVSEFPEHANLFVKQLISSNCLTSYNTIEGVQLAFQRIDRRLSDRLRNRELTSTYSVVVEKQIYNIENDFLSFFPQLIDYFCAKSTESDIGNWIRLEKSN